MLKSIIYSMIMFWCSIFLLPNQCLKQMEQMCSEFLWNGVPNSARREKVSWEAVCVPKRSEGPGSKGRGALNKVLCLKLIWLIFTSSGSLWVSWTHLHLIGNENFWTLDPSNSGSWIWQSLCKIRFIARQFVVCEVASGITMSFWKDN